jgi:hypothetical protein
MYTTTQQSIYFDPENGDRMYFRNIGTMASNHRVQKAKNRINIRTNACCRSRDSSVGIATGYWLDDHGGWEFESRRGKKFLLLHIVQTGSGVHPTSYKMGTGGSFPGLKKICSYTSTPPYVLMA